jgi:broad specificity phosphatase PhoE
LEDSHLEALYLVRHGETAWTKTGQHTGRTDLPLTDQGRTDAIYLRERFQNGAFDRVFTSPLQRARQTCDLAGFAGVATVMEDLTEWNYGDYEGLTSRQIRSGRPDWDLFRHGCPQGESVAQVAARADRVLAAVRLASRRVLIFSSGHISRVIAARWLGCDAVFGRHLTLAPVSVSLLTFEHGLADPVIGLWNDVSTQRNR